MPANTLSDTIATLGQRLRALWRGAGSRGAAAATRAGLEAALAEQRHRCTELARINLHQLDTIGTQAGRLQALATTHAAAVAALARIQGQLALAKHDHARERRANEVLGAALTRAHLRMQTIPRLEADLTALWVRLEQRGGAPEAAPARDGQLS